jgi:hypothetical protein
MKTLFKKQLEFELQKQICRYLSLQHPKILFISDATSGAKLTMQQAVRNGLIQKADFKIPDLQILEPNKNWQGLFLELKKESPYKKTGGLKKQLVTIYKTIAKKRVAVGSYDHLELQEKSMELLREKGYLACFCWSFENAIEIIENYLKDI